MANKICPYCGYNFGAKTIEEKLEQAGYEPYEIAELIKSPIIHAQVEIMCDKRSRWIVAMLVKGFSLNDIKEIIAQYYKTKEEVKQL